jgi:hypothetical protein
MYIVYKITNKKDKKVYIGFTSRSKKQRLREHYSDAKNKKGSLLHEAIRQYGKESFNISVISRVSNFEKANIKEIYFIKKYKSNDPNFGYNKTIGGTGINMFRNKEWCQKISISRGKYCRSEKGKKEASIRLKKLWTTPEFRKTYTEKRTKFRHTEESKRKMSASLIKIRKEHPEKFKNPPIRCTPHSEETKRKMSLAQKGKHHFKHTEEAKEKIRLAGIYKMWPKDEKIKLIQKHIKIWRKTHVLSN